MHSQRPGALTHTRITWALSPMAAQVPGVTPGPPCAHGVAGTPQEEVRDTILYLLRGEQGDLEDKSRAWIGDTRG